MRLRTFCACRHIPSGMGVGWVAVVVIRLAPPPVGGSKGCKSISATSPGGNSISEAALNTSLAHTAREHTPTSPWSKSRRWSDQVHQVRALLAGRRVVVVGGAPRTDAEKRIQEDLTSPTWSGAGSPSTAPAR